MLVKHVVSAGKTLGWLASLYTIVLLLCTPMVAFMASGWYESTLAGVIAGFMYASLIVSGFLLMLYPQWASTGRIEARQMVVLYMRVYGYQAIIATAAATTSAVAEMWALSVLAVVWLAVTGLGSLVAYAGLRIDRSEVGNGGIASGSVDLLRRRFGAAIAGFLASAVVVFIMSWTKTIATSAAVMVVGVLFLMLMIYTAWLAAHWNAPHS